MLYENKVKFFTISIEEEETSRNRSSENPEKLFTSKTPGEEKTLDYQIRSIVWNSLVSNQFNKSATAKELGIYRKRLDRLLNKYKLQ